MTKNLFIAIVIFCIYVDQAMAGTAYLSWNPSVDPNVTGYKIYYDTESHASGVCPDDYINHDTPIDAGNVTNYTATGLTEGLAYYFQITAYDSLDNQSECSFDPGEQSITVSGTTPGASNSSQNNSGGGGGGGGGATLAMPSVLNLEKAEIKATSSNSENELPKIKASDTAQAVPNNSQTPEQIILQEAKGIFAHDQFVYLTEQNSNLYSRIMASIEKTNNDEEKKHVAFFIQNGTPTTKILGAGERAGAIGSYISAFSRLPKSESEWEDVVKISNGRWTGERNQESEKRAIIMFKQIYLRQPDRNNNKYDDNSIMIITYGLRPAMRNIGSETAAINSFKYIFKRPPTEANDWDIVRSIAYSGAKR